MLGTVLVLDDDEIVRDLLVIALTSAGYVTEAASSADEALRLASERPPRVILFDLGLNGERGDEFVEAYRQLPDATATLVILSGASNIEQRAAALDVSRFLLKPFELGALFSAVADAYGAKVTE